ncbi:MAG: gluconolaconase [Vicinamibacterales bacterium]
MPAVTDASIRAVEPAHVLPGGRLWIRGERLPPPDGPGGITVGGQPARISFAATDRVAVVVPDGLPGGRTEVRAEWAPGATLLADVGAAAATGLHIVDSPVVTADGSIYATYSGGRGQEAPVSVFRITPKDTREPFVLGLVNATSLAPGPDGRLYVSSRFDGSVSRIEPDGHPEKVASDLGQATGLAFGPDGHLFVGDRTGTIYRLDLAGKPEKFVSLPPSVAAYHLAMGPDEALYVAAPTLSSVDRLLRITMDGTVEPFGEPFGRPQGLAFDPTGRLHVVEALAGITGIYRLRPDGTRELVVSGPRLIGLAFAPDGRMVVATADTVYRCGAAR